MGRIAREEVRRLARLARLRLDEGEVARFAAELGGILRHFEALDRLVPPEEGRAGVEAAGRDGGELRVGRTRPDEPDPDPLAAPPEAEAPAWKAGFFLVPHPPGLEGRE